MVGFGQLMETKKLKVYVSDEGFGHISRQRAILDELLKQRRLDVVLQTKQNLTYAKRILSDKIRYIRRFNNIITVKKNGGLDKEATLRRISRYPYLSKRFIQREKKSFDYDFVISDLVPEALYLSKIMGVGNIGVCHFTWDWFFRKLYPDYKVLHKLLEYYLSHADTLFFPPFTPTEILDRYHDRAVEVPLIVKRISTTKLKKTSSQFKVLILDSGTGVLTGAIHKNIPILERMRNLCFMLPQRFQAEAGNIILIPRGVEVSDYFAQADLVVARAGFNTISECVANQVPMILVEETDNPEITLNLQRVFEAGLCGWMTLEEYQKNFEGSLKSFLKNDYETVKKNLTKVRADGAEIVAREILKRL